MSPFQLFALGLVSGLTAQGLGILLRRRAPMPARALWLIGVAVILLTALREHDALLFSGQILAAWTLYLWLFRAV